MADAQIAVMTLVLMLIGTGIVVGFLFGRAIERDLWQWSYLTDTPVKVRGNSYRVIPEPTYQRIVGEHDVVHWHSHNTED